MFLPYVSNPELEGCIVTWDFFETIHSRSYTHIMKNVYADPSEVFDTILEDKEILKEIRALEELKEHMEKVTDSKARALSTALVLAEHDDYEASAKVLEESDKVVSSF